MSIGAILLLSVAYSILIGLRKPNNSIEQQQFQTSNEWYKASADLKASTAKLAEIRKAKSLIAHQIV
jgi:hypothetical protein